MSTQINDGGPAYPQHIAVDYNGKIVSSQEYGLGGISIRDYFAAHETLSDHDHPDVQIPDTIAIAIAGPKPSGDWLTNPIEWLKWEALCRAKLKHIRADAMLKAREVKL